MRKVALLPILITTLVLAACEPVDRRPGTWTSGDIVETKITDWSFHRRMISGISNLCVSENGEKRSSKEF